MLKITTAIENIEQLIKEGKFAEAEKKITETVLLFTDQIEKGNFSGENLDKTSDKFFNLFEIQLKEKLFSSQTEELLQHCFTLHTISTQESDKFKNEIESIKRLAIPHND